MLSSSPKRSIIQTAVPSKPKAAIRSLSSLLKGRSRRRANSLSTSSQTHMESAKVPSKSKMAAAGLKPSRIDTSHAVRPPWCGL